MPLIRLLPRHFKQRSFHHPLLDGHEAVSEEELEAIAYEVVADPSQRERLIFALFPLLRNIVGRYLDGWEASRRFTDEMVSEGFLVLLTIPDLISLDFLDSHAIIKVVSRRIQDAINVFLNGNQAMVSPSMKIQKRLLADDQGTVYLGQQGIPLAAHSDDYEDDGDEWKRDVLDALHKIKPRDEIEAALLDPFNWGRDNKELADELGVGVRPIRRRKVRLYKQYQQLTR